MSAIFERGLGTKEPVFVEDWQAENFAGVLHGSAQSSALFGKETVQIVRTIGGSGGCCISNHPREEIREIGAEVI